MDNRLNNNFSLYINSIRIYQWIFCALCIGPPPPLTRRITPKARRRIISILYCMYCFGFGMTALLFKYVLHGERRRGASAYQTDVMTKYLIQAQGAIQCTLNFATLSIIFCKLSSYTSIVEMIMELESELKSSDAKVLPINWKLFKTSGCHLLTLTTSVIGMNYGLMSTSLDENDKATILYYILITQTKSIEYGLYMHLVSEFLGHIHSNLKHLMSEAEDVIARRRQLPWPLLSQIIKNQMLLNRVWSLVQALEKYFAWPILLLFCLNGFAVLGVVNWTYVSRMGDDTELHLYYRVCYVTILLTNLCLLCFAAEKCIEKYKKISMLIHNFNFLTEDRSLLMRLREFSLQIKHQKLLFTCNGYLDINLSTFGKMFLVITGYIVIMLQFKIEATCQ